ncbi:hypothetical protein NSK_007183 [Nannochloropsis salina CCMP1776]|uniref:U2A'/phosphoprotein 32 family A C-terminal domain-containing protein n=1 Tax=Nannochloropsis salina CCMP1776 TaxID=1027361 RepID=A0A4D9CQL1_9STRA|nr:hypothetical protein NSK_007183 [Nannochloropsis salina CCMP1776]|eukprot:TFJ81461.1 hypothetical protein NSK_007183 [Nannochloropsis salina CCMP1776]
MPDTNNSLALVNPLTSTDAAPEGDVMGGERMTPEILRQLALNHDGYESPSLNDTLYLHFRGFRRIENLGPYTGLRALWLDSNGLTEIGEGLGGLRQLRCLYLQNNLLESLGKGGKEGGCLQGLTELVTLDVSGNRLLSLRGVEACPKLRTLVAGKNRLGSAGMYGWAGSNGEDEGGEGQDEQPGASPSSPASSSPTSLGSESSPTAPLPHSLPASEATEFEALRPLAGLPSLHTLDLSHNHLVHALRSVLPALLPSLLPSLLSLTLEANSFVFEPASPLPASIADGMRRPLPLSRPIATIQDFRKLCLLALPRLKYLDRPIFPLERAVAEGWREGGKEGGEEVKQAWTRREEEAHRENLRVYRAWAQRVKKEKLKEGKGGGEKEGGRKDEDQDGGGMGVGDGEGEEEARLRTLGSDMRTPRDDRVDREADMDVLAAGEGGRRTGEESGGEGPDDGAEEGGRNSQGKEGRRREGRDVVEGLEGPQEEEEGEAEATLQGEEEEKEEEEEEEEGRAAQEGGANAHVEAAREQALLPGATAL